MLPLQTAAQPPETASCPGEGKSSPALAVIAKVLAQGTARSLPVAGDAAEDARGFGAQLTEHQWD